MAETNFICVNFQNFKSLQIFRYLLDIDSI